jgi:20S proteasome alpha/beta subunit
MVVASFLSRFRIIMKKARTECQSHKLTVEDPVTLEYITRYVASMKQRYGLFDQCRKLFYGRNLLRSRIRCSGHPNGRKLIIAGSTKGGSIIVLLTSCLTGLY